MYFNHFQSPWAAKKPQSTHPAAWEWGFILSHRHPVAQTWGAGCSLTGGLYLCLGATTVPKVVQELEQRKPHHCRGPGNTAVCGDRSGPMLSVVCAVTSRAFNSFIICDMAAYLLFL